MKNNVAELTKEQKEVIGTILKNGNVLYVDKTGAGKSATYFIATKMLRQADSTNGPTIVVCPLLSLINDQVNIYFTISDLSITEEKCGEVWAVGWSV